MTCKAPCLRMQSYCLRKDMITNAVVNDVFSWYLKRVKLSVLSVTGSCVNQKTVSIWQV